MATPFMNLSLPIPTTTLGPAWANQLNAALEVIDGHDHSNGNGTQIKTAGIAINADLGFNEFSAFGLKSVMLATQAAALTGAFNARSIYAVGDDLYYTSGAGTAIQLTAGGSIVATPAALSTISYSVVSTDITISPSATEVFYAVNTGAARTITLPAASTQTAGRVFVISDATGQSESNTLTVLPDGTDVIAGAASLTITSNFGTAFLITNGIDRWLLL